MSDKFSRVSAIINLDNINYNINSIINKISCDTSVYAIIKADGYGHGAVQLAKEYEKIDKVRGYGVATPEEALQLIEAGIKKEILIIGYAFPYSYEALIENEIRITVFKEETLIELSNAAEKIGKKAYVHIKVDSGMGRIGVLPNEESISLIKKAIDHKNIIVEGIFTHFASSDEKDKSFADIQYSLYNEFVDEIERKLGFKFKIKHCSNSAAIIDMNYANLDAVRAGIILYGLWPSDEVDKSDILLKPAMSIVSHITYIKSLPAGYGISYGSTYVTDRETRVATIPVGYADGYQRRLSNKAFVIINGQKAPIIGRICMDQFMVDVSEISNCKEGDKVTLIGEEDGCSVTVDELSSMADMLNYEFVCDIGKRVPRRYIKNGVFTDC